ASTMKSRRGFAIQRLMNAMRQAHADGWFIVFDTLTLADDRLEACYDNPNALRDYFRDIGLKNVSVSCAYTQGKREQFSGFNRTLDAINNVFRKFSAFHDETGRLNVDGMNIISNDGS